MSSRDSHDVLDVLFETLSDAARCAGTRPAADGLVGFKTAGDLVAVLGATTGRLVRRRALVRYLAALRRRLAGESSTAHIVIQHDRGLGWRIVPRMAATRSECQEAVTRCRRRESLRGLRGVTDAGHVRSV